MSKLQVDCGGSVAKNSHMRLEMKDETRGTHGSMARRLWLGVLCMAALVGCASDELVGASASNAIGATPLPEIERDLWETAPAGCEGLLEGMEWTFGVAEGAPELVVVVDPFGGALCADTYSAVDAELREIDSDRVDGLWLSYVTTLQELEVYSGMAQSTEERPDGSLVEGARAPYLGEPNPQPNREGSRIPDVGSTENDPNPQPNMPSSGGEGGSGSGSSGSSGGEASSASLQPNQNVPTDAVAPTREAAGL